MHYLPIRAHLRQLDRVGNLSRELEGRLMMLRTSISTSVVSNRRRHSRRASGDKDWVWLRGWRMDNLIAWRDLSFSQQTQQGGPKCKLQSGQAVLRWIEGGETKSCRPVFFLSICCLSFRGGVCTQSSSVPCTLYTTIDSFHTFEQINYHYLHRL